MASGQATGDRASEHGLDRWCYDTVVQREWRWDDSSVVLRRNADLVWMAFDPNPACFCNDVLAVQPVEAFLLSGPPVSAPGAIRTAIDEHLRTVRVPGASTWVSLMVILRGSEHCWLNDVRWQYEGRRFEDVPLPGPDAAGLHGWPAVGRHLDERRMLVPPGESPLTLDLTVGGPPYGEAQSRFHRMDVVTTIRATAFSRTTVVIDVDARAWPGVNVAIVP